MNTSLVIFQDRELTCFICTEIAWKNYIALLCIFKCLVKYLVMLVLKSQTAFAILAIFECERRAEIGYHVNQGSALYNQQTSNQSIGHKLWHKCSEFPRTRFHNCRPPLICAVATSFAKLVLTKTILFCTVVV